MSMAKDFRQMLVTAGISTPIAISQLPASPDVVIALLETPSWAPQRTMRKGVAVYWLGLQMLARGARNTDTDADPYETVHDLAFQVAELLQGYKGTLNGHDYLDVGMIANPSYLGRDETKRDQFTCNFRVCQGLL